MQLVVRRTSLWNVAVIADPLRSWPTRLVTSLAENHVHFDVQNPTAYSTSREASLNTIPTVDVTIYTARH